MHLQTDELMDKRFTLVISVLCFSLFRQLTNDLPVIDVLIFLLFPTIPAVMNMMPAVRLILALVVSSMLFIVRQVREKTDMNAPRTLRTTPTIIRARTAWKVPSGQKTHTQRRTILSLIFLKLLISLLCLILPKSSY